MSERNDYIVEYTCFDKAGAVIEKKKIRAKKKLSELHAKSGLEDHLRLKFMNFGRLVVTRCYIDNPFMKMFEDALNDNPFKMP